MAERQQAIRDYKDLRVWQKGMELAEHVYSLTRHFPNDEKFGLVSQMRRAGVSVPSNLAEGQARNTTGEFVQFIAHAEGSLAELDTQLRRSVTLSLYQSAESQRIAALITDLQKMLKTFRRRLTTNH